MTTPTTCSACGHELGIGRFCVNCGTPVPGRHPGAAPPVGPPTGPPPPAPPTVSVPPTAHHVPSSARYPLYADAPGAPTTVQVPVAPPVAPPFVPAPARSGSRPPRRGVARWLPWAVGLVLLSLVAVVGVVLLLDGDDDDRTVGERPRNGSGSSESSEPRQDDATGQPDSAGTAGPVAPPDPDDVDDLTSAVRAEVPATAPPSRDRQNQPVRFVAANMWDGRPRTAWRMPGDATGETIVLDLGSEVVLTEVGLINGYAKVDGADDWYRANRRIRVVQWEFDDGTRVTQELSDQQTMQMADIDPVTTTTVRLHLLAVTAPAKGTTGRDFTAISELRLLGARG